MSKSTQNLLNIVENCQTSSKTLSNISQTLSKVSQTVPTNSQTLSNIRGCIALQTPQNKAPGDPPNHFAQSTLWPQARTLGGDMFARRIVALVKLIVVKLCELFGHNSAVIDEIWPANWSYRSPGAVSTAQEPE